jgi:hypothetical protein
MSLAIKLYDKETHGTGGISRYRLAIALFCVGLALAIACTVLTPTAIGKVGSDQTFPVGL